ncbi:MAG: SGNH/GDSL hydrolase family protein [Armatimonadetes bacterium]|nr:SGNH/GDSL hydrolase family protein [Armatimonadota bacterium]
MLNPTQKVVALRYWSLVCSITLAGAMVAMADTPHSAANLTPTLDPDGKTMWYDARMFTVEGRGWPENELESPYDRLPTKAKDMVRPPVWSLSKNSAGICVRFKTTARSIQVKWTLTSGSLALPHMPATGVSGVDLYAKDTTGRWHYCGTGRPQGVTNKTSFSVPFQPAECRIYLPLYNGTKELFIGVAQGETAGPVGDVDAQGKPVVFYGTSITQGGCASRPGMAYPSIVGRILNVPVINLGFSGNGQMDMELADLMAEIDARLYVIDTLWNMSPDLIQERAEPFITRLHALKPDVPILACEDCNFRDSVPTAKGKVLRGIVEKLQAGGITNLHFLSAKGMLGDDEEGTVDGCHPTDLGMWRMAIGFSQEIGRLLGIGR